MENEKWPPDHATSKGYPFDEVKSVISYPPDERFTATVEYNAGEETYVKIGEEQFKHKMIKSLTQQLVKCDRALAMAEQQIGDMLTEDPFLPEEFGFEQLVAPQTIQDVPVRVWASKMTENYSLYRIPGSQYGWMLQRKEEDGSFVGIPMNMPCHRIAYAVFVALGVKVEEPAKEELIAGQKKLSTDTVNK